MLFHTMLLCESWILWSWNDWKFVLISHASNKVARRTSTTVELPFLVDDF